MRWPLAIGVLSAACVSVAGAQAPRRGTPVLRAVEPAWVVPTGQPVTVRLYGQELDPQRIEFQDGSVKARVAKAEAYEGKTEAEKRRGNRVVELELTAPAGLKPGTYRFTLDPDSVEANLIVSGSLFVDVAAPEVQETEPNDSLKKPQALPAGPVTVLGKLDREGVDVFRIEGRAGQQWRFEVFARRIGGAGNWEPVLRVRDGVRRSPLRLTLDDGQDCGLTFTCPADGPYLLELFDSDNRTGGDFNYRLAVRPL